MLTNKWKKANAAQKRLLLGSAVFSIGSLLYYSAAGLAGSATVLPASSLDLWIDFHVIALIPYLSFFGLILVTFLFIDARQLIRLSMTLIACNVVGFATFVLMPTCLNPLLTLEVINAAVREYPWLYYLRGADTPKNCFPSMHAAVSVACTLAIVQKGQARLTVLWVMWTAAIFWSAIALRQHMLIDLIAGAVLAITLFFGVSKKLAPVARKWTESLGLN